MSVEIESVIEAVTGELVGEYCEQYPVALPELSGYAYPETAQTILEPVQTSQPPAIPLFEGKDVHSSTLRLEGYVLDLEDSSVRVDSIVRLVVEARVTHVSHVVDEKTGKLSRLQKAKVIDMGFLPWDPSDPTDTGVVE